MKFLKIFKSWLVAVLAVVMISGAVLAVTTVTIKPKNELDNPNGVDVIGNKLSVTDAGYLNQIREGNIPGHEYVNINGHSHAIITTDQELSALGTPSTTSPFGNWPTVAAGAVIVSTSAQDAAGGSGATLIIVRGLEDNAGSWDDVTTTIIPTGATPTAASAQTFIRVDEIEVVTCGAGLTNDGDITLSIGGTDIIEMYADHSTSHAGRKTVASGYKMYLENPEASAIGNKEMTYHIFCRDNKVANSPFVLRPSWHSKDGGYRPNGKMRVFEEKVDMVFIVHGEIAGGTASGSVEGWTETP